MTVKKYLILFCFMLLLLLLFSGCAHQPQLPITTGLPGFWKGFLHGLIAPVTFFVSLFTDVRIYEYPNAGRWYDFGFMLGISGFGGGIFRASRK